MAPPKRSTAASNTYADPHSDLRNLTNYITRALLETGGFRPQLHPQLWRAAKGGALRGNPVYDNIRFGAQITLSQAGLYTVDDFKTITKQEVLMLPGIGKKTVEQLEHNGVIFKA